MFRAINSPILRSTRLWYNAPTILPVGSIVGALPCVQWKTPDDGQRNCPKHVEFYSKNNFEKLVLVVGFIVSILHYLVVNLRVLDCCTGDVQHQIIPFFIPKDAGSNTAQYSVVMTDFVFLQNVSREMPV